MKYLAIGPGAMGIFVYLGIVHKLQELGHLHDLEEISGASAGSLVGFMFLITKKDITKTLDFALNVPIKQIMKVNLKNLIKDYGLVSLDKVRKALSDACMKFTSKLDITFQELYELVPIKFHTSSFCVDLMKTEYFSVDRTPTMSVIDAVCMSIAVPFLFSAVKHNGWHFVDGGSAENIPCAPFIGKPSSEILALRIPWNHTIQIKNLKSYGLSVMYSILSMRASYDVPILNVNTDDFDMFDFGAETEWKLKMFMKGQSQKIIS
jgi:predicted acylesterase/phospholipase RssA